MEKELHRYKTTVEWTGNTGNGTSTYESYELSHHLKVAKKLTIECSGYADFNGDASKHNPEELLLASVSSCHMLWYLHLCSEAKIVVIAYTDIATGTMQVEKDGSGKFLSISLSPCIILSDKTMIEPAVALHHAANKKCLTANSLNFPVFHHPTFEIKTP